MNVKFASHDRITFLASRMGITVHRLTSIISTPHYTMLFFPFTAWDIDYRSTTS